MEAAEALKERHSLMQDSLSSEVGVYRFHRWAALPYPMLYWAGRTMWFCTSNL